MPSQFQLGDWTVQPEVGTVTRDEVSRSLEPKVMEVLVFMARHPGEVLPKEHLIQAVWPDTFVTDWVLTRAVSELRKNLDDDVDHPQYIQTLPKRGYRLIAPVTAAASERPSERYRILEKLGEGAMAAVYLAEDQFLRRKVALKLPVEGIEQDDNVRMLLIREARAAASLDHPYICKIYDTGELNGRDFIAMEYVEGRTLKKRLAEGRLPLSGALQIASEVAEALETAHEKGIVHRDIKPSNIMLSRQGHAKVTDFGVARRLEKAEDEEQDLTATLTADIKVKGTLPYMSPEQLRTQTVDHRSDIFSLGVVLYEMLSGVNPFRRDVQMDTAAAVISGEIPDIAAYRTGTPELLQHTLGKMLARDPERRYQSAQEVKTNLAQLIEEARLQTAVRWSNTRRWMASVLIGTGSILVLTVGTILWLQLGRFSLDSTEHLPLQPVPLTSDEGLEDFPSSNPAGDEVAYVWRRPPGAAKLSGHVYVRRIGPGQPMKLTGAPAVYSATAWSPDGNYVAFLRPKTDYQGEMSVRVVPSRGGREKEVGVIPDSTLLAFDRPFRPGLSWTPDSRWLAVASRDSESNSGPKEQVERRSLFLLSVDTVEKRRLTSPRRGWDASPAFSPDGRTLAFVRTTDPKRGDLYLLPLSELYAPTGEPKRLTHLNQFVNSPTWTSDGQEIIFSAGRDASIARLWRIDRPGRKEPEILPFAWPSSLDPVITPTGDRLVYQQLSVDWNIYRSDLSSPGEPAPPEKLIASTYIDNLPSYSPDGSQIAFSSNRSGSSEIWICDQDGQHPTQVTSLEEGLADWPRWSPDGTRIAFHIYSSQSAEVDVYVVNAQGGEARRLTGGRNARWSPDGESIYYFKSKEVWRTRASGGEPEKTSLSRIAVRADQTLSSLPEEDGVKDVIPPEASCWHRTSTGVYYSLAHKGIYYRDLESREDKLVVDQALFFSVSPDGKSLLYSLEDNRSSDLMLVEGFR